MVRRRDVSEPFHHTATKFGTRLRQEIRTSRGIVKTLYPGKPSVEQQKALLRVPAICCTSCPPSKMAANGCHAVWLVNALRKQYAAESVPEVVSGKIPDDMKRCVKSDPDAYDAARAIHYHAFVTKQAVFVCRTRGNRGMPSLLPELKLGTSQFGNPFSNGRIPVPPEAIRDLFHAYVDGGFEPLAEEKVEEIVSAARA